MARRAFDSVHLYMSEVSSRLVAKTGIPSDRYHIGKLIMQGLQEAPDFISQIDGATGVSETNGSVLDRSIRCAISFTALGLKKGDAIVLMAPNYLSYSIPHNAALFLGIMVACIDSTLNVNELKQLFQTNRPKIVFGQNARTSDIEKAIELAGIDAKIVTFDEGDKHATLDVLLKVPNKKAIEDFKPTDFDSGETVAYLTSTSGTTGVPKTAMLTHKGLVIGIPYLWAMCTKFPTPVKLAIVTSPGQWLSAGFQYLFSPILRFTRLQTAAELTPEHFAEIVNKYKPSYLTMSPNLMTTMLTHSKCDFTCFDYVLMGGSAVSQDLIDEMRRVTKSEEVYSVYGMSELSGIITQHDYAPLPNSSGRPNGAVELKLVDITTLEDITEPNVAGELWARGPLVFKGYYNNPEATKETLTEDGWFRSGDIFYRDGAWNLFFVERYKLLLKYRNHQVSPVEIENVIMKHPGVFQVAVTGIPDKECGDLVVACVVPKPGCNPTAQEIKDLVKESLTDTKQLRGGVIFMKELPSTSSSKTNRKALKQLVLDLPRE